MVYHVPILVNEIIDKLNIKKDGTYIDCTLGFGGHSQEIANKLSKKGRIIGMDLDPYALKMAKEKLEGKYDNIIYYNNSYEDFPEILDINNIHIHILYHNPHLIFFLNHLAHLKCFPLTFFYKRRLILLIQYLSSLQGYLQNF